VDLEEAVLGAIMLERNAMIQVMGIMDASQFYKEAHRVIFKAIQNIFSNGDPVDILTIINHLRSTGELDTVGGAYYITQLTNRVASSANIEFHSRIIQQKFIQRELIRVCSEIIRDSFEDSEEVFDLLASAQDKMMNVFSFASGDTKDINVAIKEVLDQIDHNLSQDEVATGIPSGFNEYDKFSYGFHDGDLVIIAAEKSNGKTSIAMQMARHASLPPL